MLSQDRLLRGHCPKRGAREGVGVTGRSEAERLIATFLAKEKSVARWTRWRTKAHPEYSEAGSVVIVDDGSFAAGRLIVIAHRFRLPRKIAFTLEWQGRRVLGLDVEPGGTHFNVRSKTIVSGTHWQVWPEMDAEPDERSLSFGGWLDAFCRRAHISCADALNDPPFAEEEPELPL
jgi:hypothetical protein